MATIAPTLNDTRHWSETGAPPHRVKTMIEPHVVMTILWAMIFIALLWAFTYNKPLHQRGEINPYDGLCQTVSTTIPLT